MQKTKINSKEAAYVNNFGVEFELFGIDKDMLVKALALHGIDCRTREYTHEVVEYWKLVPDSSIRNNQGNRDRCFELVSPILNGVAGLKELRNVCLALYFCGAEVNQTCGLHVHHEALGLSQAQCENLLAFYARLERTIDAFMPASRKRNNNIRYCKSMVDAYAQCQHFTTLRELGKFHKLNFNKLNTYGTIEFRHHGGTIEFEKVYHWIVFTSRVLHLCKDKRSQSSMKYIERAWVPKHLKLQKRTWEFFKGRMKKLDDLPRSTQNVRADMHSIVDPLDGVDNTGSNDNVGAVAASAVASNDNVNITPSARSTVVQPQVHNELMNPRDDNDVDEHCLDFHLTNQAPF